MPEADSQKEKVRVVISRALNPLSSIGTRIKSRFDLPTTTDNVSMVTLVRSSPNALFQTTCWLG